MNDHYRELLRQYLIAVNDLGRHSICHVKELERRLWEAVRDDRAGQSPQTSMES